MDLNRETAWTLLTEYTKSDSLLKHALAVEAAVRGYARKFGEDEEAWGMTALLHDFDYERWPTFRIMGRDYDAAVMGAGLCGFMLGTTANAMANMEALVDRYGPAPRAFLVVPMVGAFFIDFINAVIITVCLNLWT